MKPSIVTALDIGTAHITCISAKVYADQTIEICGRVNVPNTALKNGVITDLSALADRIGMAVDQLEKKCGYKIHNVFVGVSGIALGSYKIQSSMDLDYGQIISDEHVLKLLQTQNVFNRFKEEHLIHCFPLHYALDEKRNIQNPRGMTGCNLSVVCHFITIPTMVYQEIITVLKRCHLHLVKFVSIPYAAGLSLVSESDRERGTAVIDIGAGTLSLSVFFKGILVYVGNIGFGDDPFVKDLIRTLHIDEKEAVRLKKEYGSAIVLNEDHVKNIDIRQNETNHITGSRAHITTITAARIEELLERAKSELQAKNLMPIIQKVILTGGHAGLKHLPKLAQTIFGRNAYIGTASSIKGYENPIPEDSAVIGILKSAYHQTMLDQASNMQEEKDQTSMKKLKNWIKEHL